jgi:hypothetical protein
MRKLEPPQFTALEVFQLCNSVMNDNEAQQRMRDAEPRIVECDETFRVAAEGKQLYTLDKDQFLIANVAAEEMKKAYTQRMARSKSVGRPVYDKLKAASSICPLCDVGIVSTLDHHLPKSGYPALALNPMNLVPACADCNKKKLDRAPSTAEEEGFHPYYDDLDDEHWLKARIEPQGMGVVRFYVDAPDVWESSQAARVKFYFDQLNLGYLYSANAAAQMSDIRHHLIKLLDSVGAGEVRAYLRDEELTRSRSRLNSWQLATYAALADSDWYCAGGFKGDL